jgi:FkbM family methyltransferase
MIIKVSLRNDEVEVDLDGDFYGRDFWDRVSTRRYEPDTIGFIEDNCDRNTDFMDIGAANGAMTLIAASSGSRVSSYEPDPRIFKVVERNINLNPKYMYLIDVQNKAISSTRGILKFSVGEDTSILSEIVFTGHNPTSIESIEILSLSEEMDKFHSDMSRNLIIKMDIEGAEWRILKSDEILEKLQQHNATLILAVHPGFYRPFKKRLRGLDQAVLFFWHLRNYRESVEVFNKIEKRSSIKRTNLNPVTRKDQFAKLIHAGYHEFVLKFDRKIS